VPAQTIEVFLLGGAITDGGRGFKGLCRTRKPPQMTPRNRGTINQAEAAQVRAGLKEERSPPQFEA
jgi:hypothetical protein